MLRIMGLVTMELIVRQPFLGFVFENKSTMNRIGAKETQAAIDGNNTEQMDKVDQMQSMNRFVHKSISHFSGVNVIVVSQ